MLPLLSLAISSHSLEPLFPVLLLPHGWHPESPPQKLFAHVAQKLHAILLILLSEPLPASRLYVELHHQLPCRAALSRALIQNPDRFCTRIESTFEVPLINFGNDCADDGVAEVIVQDLLTEHVQLTEILVLAIDVVLFELIEGLAGL